MVMRSCGNWPKSSCRFAEGDDGFFIVSDAARYGVFSVAVLKAADLIRSGPSAGSTGFRRNLL